MKTLFFFLIGMALTFLLLSNKNEVKNLTQDFYNNSHSESGRIDRDKYNPGDDSRFSKEERDYFKKIALSSEFSDNDNGVVCRWKSDMRIFVKGEKPDYLMDELNSIVSELNEIIDPIDIVLVDNEDESNYQILFGSEQEYNNFKPGSKEHTPNNWGLFIINSGKEIRRGTMYVDIYRCESIEGQKHLLREELTQSLGLTNDTFDYPESIFYQKWSETTEYAPIDRVLIDMLYNHW
jgi:hypothetical protein